MGTQGKKPERTKRCRFRSGTSLRSSSNILFWHEQCWLITIHTSLVFIVDQFFIQKFPCFFPYNWWKSKTLKLVPLWFFKSFIWFSWKSLTTCIFEREISGFETYVTVYNGNTILASMISWEHKCILSHE